MRPQQLFYVSRSRPHHSSNIWARRGRHRAQLMRTTDHLKEGFEAKPATLAIRFSTSQATKLAASISRMCAMIVFRAPLSTIGALAEPQTN
jgi:hypothetical protein